MPALHSKGCFDLVMEKRNLKPKAQPWRQLIAVPDPILNESPLSWLSRAALSQAASPGEFLRCLGYSGNFDLDNGFNWEVMHRLEQIFDRPHASFLISLHMGQYLRQLEAQGQCLISLRGRANYQYCAVCLYEQQVKYYRWAWRLKIWRYCPWHQREMDHACRHCGFLLQLPVNIRAAGPQRLGVFSLGQCQSCGMALYSHWNHMTKK
jgi:TniQ